MHKNVHDRLCGSPSALELPYYALLSLHFVAASCHLFYYRAVSPSFVYTLHSKSYSLGVCETVCDTESKGSRCWLCLGSSFCYPPHTFNLALVGNGNIECKNSPPVCVCVVLFFFSQVDSVTSMLRGAVVARAFEQTKSFTPARGLQGKNPIIWYLLKRHSFVLHICFGTSWWRLI